MAIQFTLEGVGPLTDDLRRAPEELAERGRQIVMTAATTALGDLRGAYPPRDPTSRSRFEPIGQAMVLVEQDQGPLHPKAWITHREILAYWYEKGTKPRATRRRGRHSTGRMPPAPTFVPITVRHQRQMLTNLQALMQAAGLTVTDGR